MKGVCVDYVHANRDGASAFGRQKWMESSRYSLMQFPSRYRMSLRDATSEMERN